MVEVVIPAGMKPWAGGDSVPTDWDGGVVLLRGHCLITGSFSFNWQHAGNDLDIIAYTPRADVADSQPHPNTVADSDVGVWCQQSERERLAAPQSATDAADHKRNATSQSGSPLREAGLCREALEAVADAMLMGGDGSVGDYGWSITKLNRARPLIRAALAPAAGGEGL